MQAIRIRSLGEFIADAIQADQTEQMVDWLADQTDGPAPAPSGAVAVSSIAGPHTAWAFDRIAAIGVIANHRAVSQVRE